MKTIADIVQRFGGPSEFARALGVGTSTASEMKRRQSIPVDHWQRLILEARSRGIDGLSYATLVSVHTGGALPDEADADDASNLGASAPFPLDRILSERNFVEGQLHRLAEQYETTRLMWRSRLDALNAQIAARPGEISANAALHRAIKRAGGVAALAKKLRISHQAILQWDSVPPRRVLDVERHSGVSRHELRPDMYPAETGERIVALDQGPAVEGGALGSAIRNSRERRKLTQQQLAEAVGVSRSAVAQWEAGETDPSTENIDKVREVLHLKSIESFLDGGRRK
jgi:DNA-binding transcriptional regulator YdaS (Cro superfamily)